MVWGRERNGTKVCACPTGDWEGKGWVLVKEFSSKAFCHQDFLDLFN